MHTKCTEPGCNRPGFHIGTDDQGEPVIRFKTRHDGKPHEQVISLTEVRNLLECQQIVDNSATAASNSPNIVSRSM